MILNFLLRINNLNDFFYTYKIYRNSPKNFKLDNILPSKKFEENLMKASLIALMLTTTLFSANSNAGLFDGLKIGKSISNSQTKDVYAGVKFQYFDQNDRIQIINDLLKTVELEYAPLQVKEKRIGLNLSQIKSEAIAAEQSVENVLIAQETRSNPEVRAKIAGLQAKSNMEFLDRMQLLVAKFQDSHFSIQERISRPMVYNGLRLRRVQGMVVIGGMDKRFFGMVQKLSGSDLSAIKIGDQVISIDGVNVEDKINELKKYISGSSDEFRESQAIRSLTLRNLFYPTKNYMTIEFKSAGTFKLPYFQNTVAGETPRLDANQYLQSLGIPSDSMAIGMTFNTATRQWVDSGMQFDGYSPWKLHANLKGLVEYADDGGSPGMRTGYFMKNGKTYGVLQLLTFHTKNLKNGDNSQSFLDAIRGFVAELKDNGMPLILDLRNNPGGNGNFPAAVLGILSKTGLVYGGSTSGYRMTPYIRQLEEGGLFQEVVAEDVSGGITMDTFTNMLQTTIDNRKEVTPMFSYSAVENDPKIGGFDNKIVALITADCVSACDMMSSLLKSSKRATLIGTHSNGTGAGFLSTSSTYDSGLNTQWTDSLRVFSSQIPNHLFGRSGDPEVRFFGENSVYDMDLENDPTIADIQYTPQAKDFIKNNLGWLDKAVETIENLK
jgi:C-terminal processing protease CtpA/Prc